jgi:hypothetical protein
MNSILIFSQDGNLTTYARSIAIGQRQENYLIGDKLQALLDNKKMTLEELIGEIGNSYRDSVTRVYNNQEIPKKQLLDKLIKYFDIDDNYFKDKNLKNVIITDGGVVVGTYSSNEKALEVKQQLDKIIEENTKVGNFIILHIPKEQV